MHIIQSTPCLMAFCWIDDVCRRSFCRIIRKYRKADVMGDPSNRLFWKFDMTSLADYSLFAVVVVGEWRLFSFNAIRVHYLVNGGRWVAAGMIYVMGRTYLIDQRSDDERTTRCYCSGAARNTPAQSTFASECMFAYACA